MSVNAADRGYASVAQSDCECKTSVENVSITSIITECNAGESQCAVHKAARS